ncbi:MAG: hypothetical protein CME65_09575 [Halobacteriovoraceae bacterium]|nr:hypothetical protein [Halobacteriovoraceae bacterium]
MDKALVKKSDILKIKYKFFINRIVTYFSFLLLPLLIQKTENLALFTQCLILLVYILFMGSQWYLFGKEIDHRLKIYYKANSSLERIIYRLLLGNIGLILLFNLFSLLPAGFVGILFWGFFIILGIFYSWPTRGKIIEETMVSQFSEIRYLDAFEKTILSLSVVTFFITLPDFPLFENVEALKLYLDPYEKVSFLIWNYLSFLYYPFQQFPKLYNLIWNFHFYFIGLGSFLFAFYCLLRYFFSRRLSMLGTYAIISSWSLSRLVVNDFFNAVTSGLPLVWLWSVMWSTRSGTYRSGLFTGLIFFYLVLFNPVYILLMPLTLLGVYFGFLPKKTVWFKRQWIKYNVFGTVLGLLIAVVSLGDPGNFSLQQSSILSLLQDAVIRKAFFIIAPLGLLLIFLYVTNLSNYLLTYINLDRKKLNEVLFGIGVLVSFGFLLSPNFFNGLAPLWALSFLALFPIEWIFQSISRLRSKRNLIYGMYILVCLLDSQMENRIRIVAKMFLDNESLKYLIQY